MQKMLQEYNESADPSCPRLRKNEKAELNGLLRGITPPLGGRRTRKNKSTRASNCKNKRRRSLSRKNNKC